MENRFLKKLHSFIFTTRRRYFLLALFSLMLFKTGVGEPGNLRIILPFVQNPFANAFLENPDLQYLLTSWLGPFLMWLLDVQNGLSIFFFYFGFSLLFSALFFYCAWRFLPDFTARITILIFAIFPVSTTAYFWVCMDSLTLFLMLCPFAFYKKIGGGGAKYFIRHYFCHPCGDATF